LAPAVELLDTFTTSSPTDLVGTGSGIGRRSRVVAAVPTRAAVSAAGFDPSFAAVLALAQDGDRGAFEQMYRLLHRRVLAFARVRRCPDPEGLVNDVFLQVFRSLSTFDGTENQFTVEREDMGLCAREDALKRAQATIAAIRADHQLWNESST
jgi:hypothetical protein